MKEAINPITIYVDKKTSQISDKKKKDKDKFYIDKTIKFKGQEINLDLEVKKKHAYIGGVGAFVFILIVASVIYCCIRRKRR